MADQDGLRFLFDIQDKITAKLAKLEAKSKASAAKIDKAFTRVSKSQEANTAKAVASEQRRVIAVEKSHAKAVSLLQRESAARDRTLQRSASASSRHTAKAVANEQRRVAAVEKAHTKAVALLNRESAARSRSTAKAIANEQKRIVAVEKSHAKAVTLLKRESAEFKRSMGRMATAATVAFAAVSGKAIQMAGGYDLAMRSVQAKTSASGELMDRLSEQSREMGRTTVHSATEAARGQAFLAQAGFDANEVLEALPATLALATAGELDLASAADIASNVLSGFRLETDQTARVTDVLAKAADSSNTNVAQLGAALAKAAPSAAAAGWSLEETAAAIGKLSDAGIQGEEAGTALKTMMAKLAIAGGPAEKLMAKMGITVKDTTGQMLPLNDILTALAPHANDVGLQFELLGTRGGNAGLVLGAMSQDARALTDELIDSAGWAQKNADIMSGGLWGAIKAIQSIVESAYISFGERFTPAVQTLAKVFEKLPSPIQEVVVVVGSLAGAMGGLMIMMPGVFGAITRLPGKLIALTTKIATTTLSLNVLTVGIKAVWTALMGPVGLAIAIGAATLALGLFWRESQKAENKVPRLAKQIEDLTARIEKQGFANSRQRRRLIQLNKAYDDTLATTRELPPQLTLASLGFALVEKAAAKTEDPIVAVDEAAKDLTDTIEWQSAKLDHWGLQLAGLGIAVKPIPPFLSTLTGTIEDQSAALDNWGLEIEGIGKQFAGPAGLVIAEKWYSGLTTLINAETISKTIADAFVGGGGLWGAVKALGTQVAGFFMGKFQGVLSKGLTSVLPSVFGAAMSSATPVLASSALGVGTATGASMATATGTSLFGGLGAVAAAIPVWGWAAAGVAAAAFFFKGWGGPSKAEKEARKIFAGFHKGATDALGGTQRYADEVQRAIDDGWDRTLAETRAGFILWGTDAGLTYDQAFADYERYQNAVKDGNTELMLQIEADYAAYRAASAETTDAVVHDAAEIGAQFKGLTVDEAAKLGDALLDLGRKAHQGFSHIHNSALAAANALADRLLPQLYKVRKTLSDMPAIPTRTPPGRAAGGPVLAGHRYRVGERGPEDFVPSRSGRIEPNGSSSGGGVDAKALAKAVADALHGTRVDVDGRQLGRLTIRHQPLAVAELGGRR